MWYTMNFISGSVPAEVPPLGVHLMNGSPQVTESSVEAEFEVTRPVAGVRCFLRSKTSRTWKDCKISYNYVKGTM